MSLASRTITGAGVVRQTLAFPDLPLPLEDAPVRGSVLGSSGDMNPGENCNAATSLIGAWSL